MNEAEIFFENLGAGGLVREILNDGIKAILFKDRLYGGKAGATYSPVFEIIQVAINIDCEAEARRIRDEWRIPIEGNEVYIFHLLHEWCHHHKRKINFFAKSTEIECDQFAVQKFLCWKRSLKLVIDLSFVDRAIRGAIRQSLNVCNIANGIFQG